MIRRNDSVQQIADRGFIVQEGRQGLQARFEWGSGPQQVRGRLNIDQARAAVHAWHHNEGQRLLGTPDELPPAA